jgi:hypothetical protein
VQHKLGAAADLALELGRARGARKAAVGSGQNGRFCFAGAACVHGHFFLFCAFSPFSLSLSLFLSFFLSFLLSPSFLLHFFSIRNGTTGIEGGGAAE